VGFLLCLRAFLSGVALLVGGFWAWLVLAWLGSAWLWVGRSIGNKGGVLARLGWVARLVGSARLGCSVGWLGSVSVWVSGVACGVLGFGCVGVLVSGLVSFRGGLVWACGVGCGFWLGFFICIFEGFFI